MKRIWIKSFILVWLITAFEIVAMPQMTYADRYKNIENATPQEVADGMGTKFTRGIANVITGWWEFPKQIYLTTKDDGWAKGTTVGPFKGVVMTLTRTAAGAAELVTFFVPYPGFYEPYFDPPYVWMKE
jgi:putative exosortase-associated protein (TIGR04073 family)